MSMNVSSARVSMAVRSSSHSPLPSMVRMFTTGDARTNMTPHATALKPSRTVEERISSAKGVGSLAGSTV
eukprot:5717260-Pyramimonas_sp.AAC.1